MSEMSNEAVQAQIESRGMREGNTVKTSSGVINTSDASTPLYNDSNATLQAGAFPFAVLFNAGSTITSVLDITGSATGSANELMHLTLVSSANATATVAGYYRINVTDSAGVVTSGNYYAPFYTLG